MIDDALDAMPLVAILRGIRPGEAVVIGDVLYRQGLRCIEVPLNSPSAFESIRELASSLPDDCLVGAGTVVNADDVQRVHAAGGRLIVTPNTSVEVISAALDAEMQIVPGVATPTEAFTAVQAGAAHLKLFPASTYGPSHIRAMRAVLPHSTKFLAVGGIGSGDIAKWRDVGVVGFGIGSELYQPGDTDGDVENKAAVLVAALA